MTKLHYYFGGPLYKHQAPPPKKLTYAERKFGNGWFALGILIILVTDALFIYGGSKVINWIFGS